MVLATYTAVGMFSYKAFEPSWSYIDCLYFVSATMSTVGYGDYAPTSWPCRVFTIAMIFVGIGIVFPLVSASMAYIIGPLMNASRAMLERAFPRKEVDIDGNGVCDYKVPRHPIIYYSKNLLPWLFLNVIVQCASAGLFVLLEPSWSFWDAIYHCIVSATTVGFGDVHLLTEGAKLWAAFHMFVGVCLFANLLSILTTLHIERRDEYAKIRQLQLSLNAHLHSRLLWRARHLRRGGKGDPDAFGPGDSDHAGNNRLSVGHGSSSRLSTSGGSGGELEHADKRGERGERGGYGSGSGDDSGISELEFVLAMLIELNIVKWDQFALFVTQFRAFDIDGNGRLDAIDVQLATARSPKQRAMLKKAASMLNVTEDDTEDSVSDTVDASPMRISAIKVRNALRLTPQPSSTTESPVSWDVGADAPTRIAPSGVSAPGTVSGTAPEQAHAQLGAQQHNRKPPPTWEPEPVWDPEERPTWASETPPSRHSSRRSSNGSSGKNETAQLQWICTQESGIFANEERRREFFL